MIFLDANFFLRALTRSPRPDVQRMNRIAGDLMRRAERGEVELTTCDAVIAEVAFILTSKAHYNHTVADAAGRLGTLLRVRGVKLRDKRVLLRALDLWTGHPRLGFVDALAASYVQHTGMDLASFDRDFDDLTGISRWQPPEDVETADGEAP
ncbi:MAG: type II toxin-antitoxin system VapC family toxin [Chloroflexia bacterium]|nr:type II toxin-antitoxin system VapC family toxin [Chloroflexia bacterium]